VGTIEKQVAVTLVSLIFLAIFGVGYVLIEPTWREERARGMTEHSAKMGAELFQTAECFKCHGQNGYGLLDGSGPGWPLNTTQNQRGTATERESRRQLLYRTIDRGRGAVMVANGRENGGPLNPEQINTLVDYIQHGHWPVAPVDGEAAVLVQGGGAAADGSRGAQLFSANGCVGCHQVKGQGGTIGPSLNTIGTQAATRKPGVSAEEYIRESIVNPAAFVGSGFQTGVMPTTFSQLSQDDLKALVDYLLEQK
jgi:mono/diheme cytochrome c family protein